MTVRDSVIHKLSAMIGKSIAEYTLDGIKRGLCLEIYQTWYVSNQNDIPQLARYLNVPQESVQDIKEIDIRRGLYKIGLELITMNSDLWKVKGVEGISQTLKTDQALRYSILRY